MNLEKFAFDNAPIGMVLAEGRIIKAANQKFAQLTGRTLENLIGHSMRIIYDNPREFEDFRDIGLHILSQGECYSDERLLTNVGGSATWCRFRAQTLTPEEPLSQIVMTYAPIANLSEKPALTPREREVVVFLSQGRTSKEIAQVLGLSPRTIEDVRAKLMRKFSVRNVAELLTKLSQGAL